MLVEIVFTRIFAYGWKNTKLFPFIVFIEYFDYFCDVLGRGSWNRHNFRDVSHLSFIWIWTIHCCEGSEQSVHLNGIYHLRVCYIIGRGCCLLFAAGSPEPKWDNELIPTSFLFNLLSSGNCGGRDGLFALWILFGIKFSVAETLKRKRNRKKFKQ